MPLFTVEKLSILPETLHERYIVPPFSVINTHQPYVKSRFKFWESLGLCAESGRAEQLAYDNRRMNKRRKKKINGTSVFNPVLCEVLYKWFTIPNSRVLDPFAGGVVRGAMASILGHSYVGYDISESQVDANIETYQTIQNKVNFEDHTKWICEDAKKIRDLEENESYDFVITCPPYFDLEHYTDNENDLSNSGSYFKFIEAYADILEGCVEKLKEDSFFAIVVGEIRNRKTTEYYGFVPDTITILKATGMHYYNEIILYNETGNLAITSGNYLDISRKVGKQHQNVLIFYKGNINNIKTKFKSLTEH